MKRTNIGEKKVFIHLEMSFNSNWYHRSIWSGKILWKIIKISCKILSSILSYVCNWNPRNWDSVVDGFDTVVIVGLSLLFITQVDLWDIGVTAYTSYKSTEFVSSLFTDFFGWMVSTDAKTKIHFFFVSEKQRLNSEPTFNWYG
jgi:hypothetical protein